MDLELLCCEGTLAETATAYPDKALLSERVFRNLLKAEDAHLFPGTFLRNQPDITADMRRIVAEWMMEVCDEQSCQDEVFLLAMNYMDRYLASTVLRKSQLQLLGSTCLLIASKLRESQPLAAKSLVFYTDNSITVEQIRKCELLVMTALKWDLSIVTPQDFVMQILRRLPVESFGIEFKMANTHTKTLIALCTRDYDFYKFVPSTLASACIASSLCGLGWTNKSGQSPIDLLRLLQQVTHTELDYIFQCFKKVERMLNLSSWPAESNNMAYTDLESCTPVRRDITPVHMFSTKLQDQESAGTPTDVRDVHF